MAISPRSPPPRADQLVALVTNIRLPRGATQGGWNGSKFRTAADPPQFALNDAQSAQKAAPLDRHERLCVEGNLSLTTLDGVAETPSRTRSVRERGCARSYAFGILLLGLTSAAPEPEYSSLFAEYAHDAGADSPLVAGRDRVFDRQGTTGLPSQRCNRATCPSKCSRPGYVRRSGDTRVRRFRNCPPDSLAATDTASDGNRTRGRFAR